MAGKMQGDGTSDILAPESLELPNIRGLRNATGVRSVPANPEFPPIPNPVPATKILAKMKKRRELKMSSNEQTK